MGGVWGEGIGAASGGEVDGDSSGGEGFEEVGVGGPEGGGGPVVGGIGDEARFVLGDKVAKELEWGWWGVEPFYLSSVGSKA